MPEATFTFRVEPDLKAAFTEAAKAHDQTGAQLLRRYMRDYVQSQLEQAEHDAWVCKQVQAGLASANAGRLIDAEEVEAHFAARRVATGQKGPSA